MKPIATSGNQANFPVDVRQRETVHGHQPVGLRAGRNGGKSVLTPAVSTKLNGQHFHGLSHCQWGFSTSDSL
jgi:hypothetical protein